MVAHFGDCIILIENGELFFESFVQQQGKETSLGLENVNICAKYQEFIEPDEARSPFK